MVKIILNGLESICIFERCSLLKDYWLGASSPDFRI